jgi:hypothetical protein
MRVRLTSENSLLAASFVSVRRAACISAASPGRIFVRFGEFYEKYVQKLVVCWKFVKNFGHFTVKPKHFYIVDSTAIVFFPQ